MDEILIEEKKYVSSKQAAKATGYAKDYIGQLCREGRVPARLVGRSWYVLESALHDHRFGSPKDEPVEAEKSASTWESPRYKTFDAEEFPVVSRLHKLEGGGESQEPNEDVSETAQRLQETWQAWFDRFDAVVAAPAPEEPASQTEEVSNTECLTGEEMIEPEEERDEAVEAETEVPVRAIHHQPYQPAPREFLPSHTEQEIDTEDQFSSDEDPTLWEKLGTGRGRRLILVIQSVGIIIAVITVSLATLGSGYFDKYIVSNSQVGLVAGVALYNR